MAPPTLLVLAGGMSRRFGALKQVAAVTADGASLLDRTIADAAAAGMGGVVVVVRPSIRAEVAAHLARRSPLSLTVVEQPEPEPGRSRPWGAADAVARGLAACPTPALSVNADDHYGADALGAMVGWLEQRCEPGRAALATWAVRATTSARGPVTRAVVRSDDGHLAGLDEVEGIELDAAGAVRGSQGALDPQTPVSMNMWGLHPSLAPSLSAAVDAFRADHLGPDDELPLPTAIDGEVRAGRLTVEVLPVGRRWVGITHPDDLADARVALAAEPSIPVLSTSETTSS